MERFKVRKWGREERSGRIKENKRGKMKGGGKKINFQ